MSWIILLTLDDAAAQTVEKWDTAEFAFQGGSPANPFRDVQLGATFTHESGRSLKGTGFFGSGSAGGPFAIARC